MTDFVGTENADTFGGTSADDRASGGGGNDTLSGGVGYDTLIGGTGSDKLSGGADSDVLFSNHEWLGTRLPDGTYADIDSGSEVDTLIGGSGDDYFYAGYGDNVTGDGGPSDGYTDVLSISFSAATAGVKVVFSSQTLVIGGGTIKGIDAIALVQGSSFDDDITDATNDPGGTFGSLYGMGGNDRLISGYYTASLYGGEGNDYLDDTASQYARILDGGSGDDIIVSGASNLSRAYGGDGNDTISTGAAIYGGNGDDTINQIYGYYARPAHGGAGNDTITGASNSNSLIGNEGADIIRGDEGDDYLFSGGTEDAELYDNLYNILNPIYAKTFDNALDHDQLFGGADNDLLSIGFGDDADGGTGDDQLIMTLGGAAAGVTLNTGALVGGGFGFGGGWIANIETVLMVVGSAHGDNLTAHDQATAVVLAGGDGNDLLTAASAGSRLHGDAGDDRLEGGAGADILAGGMGADIVNGGGGNDVIVIKAQGEIAGDVLDGGAGYDVLNLLGQETNITGLQFMNIEALVADTYSNSVTMTGEQLTRFKSFDAGIIYLSTGGTVALKGIEALTGNFAFSQAGNRLDLTGVIREGSFSINGREGNDELIGSDGHDWFYANGGDDLFYVRGGNDYFDGGNGIDTVSYALLNAAVEVDLGMWWEDPVNSNGDSLENVENVHGTRFNDILSGNEGANELRGMAGADRLNGEDGADLLDGGAGADEMIGGLGNDRFIVDTLSDVVVEAAGEGYDTIDASISYNLTGSNVEALRLTGLAANGTGNELANAITGNAAANRIDGGAGADKMEGGGGNDRYIVDDAGDAVIEKDGEGIDLVEASASFSLAGQFVEKLTLTGTAAIDGTGNGLVNLITGNNQANRIDGGAGADELVGRKGDDIYVVDNVGDKVIELDGEGSDTVNASVTYSLAGQFAEVLNLTGSAVNGTGNGLANRIVGNELANTINGGAGNDRLDGGAGADTMVGGTGNDVFVVDNVADKVGEKTGEGTDTVEASISYSLAGQYIEVLKLTGAADLSATGNNQANSLFGNAGANLLDGKGGADTMAGGAGNDRYVVDDAGDKVVELAGEGTDSVEASVTFSLAGQYAENLTLTGSAAINGTGNGLANILAGNSAANTLSGGAGDDVLNGGLGADKLYGGTGADVFVFDTGLGPNNVDQVLDFVAADDTIRLDRSVFGALVEGALSASVFVAGTAALDAGDRIVFDKATGNLWYDADGSGAGAALLFANFGAGETLSAADFVVVP